VVYGPRSGGVGGVAGLGTDIGTDHGAGSHACANIAACCISPNLGQGTSNASPGYGDIADLIKALFNARLGAHDTSTNTAGRHAGSPDGHSGRWRGRRDDPA
jgi:hypothetical protein